MFLDVHKIKINLKKPPTSHKDLLPWWWRVDGSQRKQLTSHEDSLVVVEGG